MLNEVTLFTEDTEKLCVCECTQGEAIWADYKPPPPSLNYWPVSMVKLRVLSRSGSIP